MALAPKQKRFVEEYLVDLNATQAAVRAGYSAKTAEQMGYQLLQKTSVQASIQSAMKKRSMRVEITQDRVLQELAYIAFSNGADFAKVIEKLLPPDPLCGGPSRMVQVVEMTPTDELPPDKRAAIAGIEETKNGIKVSSHDKVRALELIGKHLGMFDGKNATAAGNENNLLDAIVQSAGEDIETDDLPEVQ